MLVFVSYTCRVSLTEETSLVCLTLNAPMIPEVAHDSGGIVTAPGAGLLSSDSLAALVALVESAVGFGIPASSPVTVSLSEAFLRSSIKVLFFSTCKRMSSGVAPGLRCPILIVYVLLVSMYAWRKV